ncbi:sulfatase [Streptomyces lincolnensis]|uniref:sulfatase n=1 Tax=Streptomyces lincolnensis TaxID=1915 RepID=UPI001E3B183D|nr:sulfatase [Streptomyces lincolnensis]MCD7444643.1 sulfatase [Streptomyces lincolnensis]
MSLFTRSRQLPDAESGAVPDGDHSDETSAADGTREGDAAAETVAGEDEVAGTGGETEGTGDEAEGASDRGGTAEREAATEPEAAADPDGTAHADGTAEPETPADPDGTAHAHGTAEPEAAAVEATEETPDSPAPGWFGWRRRFPRTARGVAVGSSVLAGAVVLGVLLVPNRLERVNVEAFLRLPVEAILLAVVLLALPPRPRRVAAVAAGVFLGLFATLKFLDMGFYQFLARPFDLVFDWILLNDATDFLRESFGRTGQVLAVVGVIVLFAAVLALSTLAVVRLTNVMARHRPAAVRTTLVLGTAWITCFTLGAQVGGVTIATKGNSEFLANRVQNVYNGLGDAKVFEKEAGADAFADTPPDQLLTGLRGKDVLFTFIESYGRVALDDPEMAPEMDAALKEGTSSLKAAGFQSRSGWLRSPVAGAGSWLAHSTFLSGLWVKNQQRYRSLTTGDRATLTSYFQKTGAWRTVGIVPGVRKTWPEGKYFGLDNIYDSEHLGYHGPYFSWTPVPDQFSMEAFQRLEHGKKDRDPIMAEIILASSHSPWSPVAHMIDWDDLGDGSVFHRIKKEGTNPTEVWKDPKRVRTEYRKAVEYSLHSVIEWLQRYGDDNTVLVFLGDHQPVPTVTRNSPNKDVPITIVARDQKVLDRISGWGWTDGLRPADNAPTWGMDQFRDRFMTAYAK